MEDESVFKLPRLTSCCCCFSTRIGSLILGIITLVASVLGFLGAVCVLATWGMIASEIRKHPPDEAIKDVESYINLVHVLMIVILVASVFGILTASMLIRGVKKEHPGLMLPYIVMGAIDLIVGVVMNILAIVGGATIISIVSMVLGTIIGIYYLLVVHSHYQELSAREGRISVPSDGRF